MAKHHSRPLYCFSSPPGFSDFSSRQFSGGVTGSHRTPQGSKGSPSYLQRNPRVDSEESYRPNRRFSVTLPFTYFRDFQEIGSSSDFESEENQCFHFGTTFSDGNSLRVQDWAVSLDLKDAYLPVPVHPQSRRLLGFKYQDKTYVYKVLPFGLKDSPWVFSRIVATVIAHLRLQGIPIFYYLDDWLLVAKSQSLLQPTFNHSSVGPEFGVHRQSAEVGAHPSEDARLPRCLSRYPQVDRTSGGAQSGGSTVVHTGTYSVSDSSCSPVAESSRPFDQLRGSGSKL